MPSALGPFEDPIDLVTEASFAAILLVATVALIAVGHRRDLSRRPGWRWIPLGIGLLGAMATLDFLDEFNDNLWMVAGADLEPYLEDMALPLSGVALILVGLLRWAPLHAALDDARTAVHQAEIDRLREMDAFKTTFLNTAAHELATPLTPIRLQLSMMDDVGIDNKTHAMLERNFTRLERLVADLMDAARLQSGHLAITLQPTGLDNLVNEMRTTLAERCRDARLRFEADIEPDLHLEAADEDRLSQILYNFASNAIKFTPADGRIRLTAHRDGDHVAIGVADTGHGLDAAELQAIFLPFQQHHRELVGPNVGTGLGLYISQGIAQAHGGTIQASSEGRGKGATFALRLPIVRIAAPPTATARAPTIRLVKRAT